MHRRTLLAATSGAVLAASGRARAQEPVDVALVLAVDVSRSIDEDEAKLQREGYRDAVTDPAVIAAIRGGMIGCELSGHNLTNSRIVQESLGATSLRAGTRVVERIVPFSVITNQSSPSEVTE